MNMRTMKRTAMKRTGFKSKVKPPREKRPSKLPPELQAQGHQSSTPEEKEYMGRVAAFGCVLCRLVFGLHGIPAHVHHLKFGNGTKKAPHHDTMPLCREHHIGDTGIHMLGQERFEQMYGMTEVELLARFRQLLGVEHA